jgi:NADPH-dependent glutamate synthase beta subunit-like oxidoreductase
MTRSAFIYHDLISPCSVGFDRLRPRQTLGERADERRTYPDQSSRAMTKEYKVAIVGGGMCGLVCAIGLQKAGIEVEIYEAAVSTVCLRSVGMMMTVC